MTVMAQGPETNTIHRNGTDVSACLDLLQRAASHMQKKPLMKYCDLLQAARLKVYGPALSKWNKGVVAPGPAPVASSSCLGDVDSFGLADTFDLDGSQTHMFANDASMATYLDQITGYLDDGGLVNADEGLAAWYGSVMDEIQSGRISGTS